MVKLFPTPEPWPTELFEQYGIADLEQLVADCQAEIDRRKNAAAIDSTCPDCSEYVHPTQTLCEGCGSRLTPNSNGGARTTLDGTSAGAALEVTVPMEPVEPHCTCGGNGICTHCVLQSYEDVPLEARGMMIALDMTAAALARPANVVPIGRHSRRVTS